MSNLFFNFSKLTHEFLGKRGVLPSTYNMMKDWFSVHVCTNVVGRALGVGLIFMLCGPTDGLNVVSEKTILT